MTIGGQFAVYILSVENCIKFCGKFKNLIRILLCNCSAVNMSQQKRFFLLWCVFICLVSISLIEASKIALTQNELREKYGQGMFGYKIRKKVDGLHQFIF